MLTQKQRNLFPELNLPALQKYVSSLDSQYSDSLKRVVLHRFKDPEHEYLLAFELSDDEESRTALLNSMALELSKYEKHLPGFYLNREACNERDWLFLPIFERDPRYSEMTIEGGELVLFDSQARGVSRNIPQHRESGFYRGGDF